MAVGLWLVWPSAVLAAALVAGCSSEAVSAPRRSGEVSRAGATWTARVAAVEVYSGRDMQAAVQAALDNLTPGRRQLETVHVRSSGVIGSYHGPDVTGIRLPSHAGVDFHGNTIEVRDTGEELVVPLLARSVADVEIRNVVVKGNPRYGIWIQSCSDVVLSNIHVDIAQARSVGLCIRVDDRRGETARNLTIDYARVENCGHHGVETYGLDGFTIGVIEAYHTKGSGLQLNDSRNGSVDTVVGEYNSWGRGYATFRVANNNGPNVVVNQVLSRHAGRGFFSVSGSHGTLIGHVDIDTTTKGGIYLQDANDTHVFSGRVANGHPNCRWRNTKSSTLNVTGCP